MCGYSTNADLCQNRLVGRDDISVKAVVAVNDGHLHERVRAHLVLRDETLPEPAKRNTTTQCKAGGERERERGV